jgi:hypothetical protein
MAGQLNLFKGKKQRGTAAPAPSEFALHCAVADTIRRFIMPGWRWTHIASGEKRDVVTASRLKRMGVNKGWPDLVFLHREGQACFLELKRKGNGLTDEQAELRDFLIAAGHGYVVTNNYKIAIDTLMIWGVVRSVEVQ